METLKDVVENLENLDFDDEATVFVTKPFNKDSKIKILNEVVEDIHVLRNEGYYYLLEAYLMGEVLEVWQKWRNGRVPNLDEKVDAIIYYAENDAYLPA